MQIPKCCRRFWPFKMNKLFGILHLLQQRNTSVQARPGSQMTLDRSRASAPPPCWKRRRVRHHFYSEAQLRSLRRRHGPQQQSCVSRYSNTIVTIGYLWNVMVVLSSRGVSKLWIMILVEASSARLGASYQPASRNVQNAPSNMYCKQS